MIFQNCQQLAIETLAKLEKNLAKFRNPDRVGAKMELAEYTEKGWPKDPEVGEFRVAVSPYVNGRERGYTFDARFHITEDAHLDRGEWVDTSIEWYGRAFRATFSEARSSENVVIYFEEYEAHGRRGREISERVFSGTFHPSDESYENAKYALTPVQAAKVIEKRFRKWAKGCEEEYKKGEAHE